MKRFLAASAVLLAVAACQPKAEPVAEPVVEAPLIPAPEAPVLAAPVGDIDPETAALAGVWLLTAAAAPDKPCRITLVAADVAPGLLVTRLASLEPACIEAVPVTAKITQWSASGDGGVFLMGSAGGDTQENVLELRPTNPTGVFAGTDAAGVKYELHPAS